MPTHTAGALYRLLVSHARGVEKMVPPPVRRVCLYYYILPKHFINRPGQLLRKPLYGKRATLSRRKKISTRARELHLRLSDGAPRAIGVACDIRRDPARN